LAYLAAVRGYGAANRCPEGRENGLFEFDLYPTIRIRHNSESSAIGEPLRAALSGITAACAAGNSTQCLTSIRHLLRTQSAAGAFQFNARAVEIVFQCKFHLNSPLPPTHSVGELSVIDW
jgi:hypothetical protein